MSTSHKKAVSSFFWSFAERFGQQGIQFFFSIALARLLAPSDFGIIGMIVVFMVLSSMVVDSGFGQTLVQRREISEADMNTVFWFSMMVGTAMTGIIFLAAPWIAAFYNQPILVPLTRLAAFQVLINSSSVVQRALLQRELLFRLRAKITLVAVTVSGVLAVAMAYNGFGVWSLAWQTPVFLLVMNIGFWLFHSWRPRMAFDPASFKQLYAFSSRIFAASLINVTFTHLLAVLIGKFYTPAALGFYTRAQNLVRLVSNSISGVLGQVNFPILARMAHDKGQTVRMFSKVLVFSVVLVAPVMFGLMAAAPQVIEVLLGPKWMPVVAYLVPVGIVGITFPIQYLNQDSLMAMGRSGLFLKLEIAKKTAVGVCLALTVSRGVLPMVWGQTVAACFGMALNMACMGRCLGYGIGRQFKDFGIILLLCAVMGAGVYGIGKTGCPLPMKLALQIGGGAVGYVLMLCLYSAMAPASVCGGLASAARAHLSERLARRHKRGAE